MTKILLCAAAASALVASSVEAREPKKTATPAQVQRLLACRAIADSTQRVQCFDREAAAVDQAIASRDLVLVDRATANATRRSLFGFAVPNFGNVFGNEQDEVKEVLTTVKSARHRLYEGWTVTMVDGSVWTQTDDTTLGLEPRRGDKIVIRRRTFGNYTMSVSGQPGVRVRRVG